jgi:L-ascorbate metabolism protein UlaG (beta-lactamase superfamily)
MKTNRRNFLRKSFLAAIGSLFAGSGFFYDTSGTKYNPIVPTFKPDPSNWKEDEVNIAWIGHATLLINFFGKIILTDPVFFERVGLYFLGMTFGPSRYTLPALNIEEIPKPDLVLISHAHMDHMDYATLLELTDTFPNQLDCITAYNTADVIAELSWKSLNELDWGEEINLDWIRIKALEVKHFGWRYPWEKDRSKGYITDGRSFNAYILERNGKKILFGGDTALTEKFKEYESENIEVAIMPIGAYNPWKHNHCNPEEALVMTEYYLKAKYFIPIHFYTFKQGREPIEEPLNWLMESQSNYNLTVGLNNIGETFNLRS